MGFYQKQKSIHTTHIIQHNKHHTMHHTSFYEGGWPEKLFNISTTIDGRINFLKQSVELRCLLIKGYGTGKAILLSTKFNTQPNTAPYLGERKAN